MVAERTVPMLLKRAASENIKVEVVPAMSFLELLYVTLQVDPIQGLLITDAFALQEKVLDFSFGTVITQLYDKHMASEVKLTLMDYLPDDYEVSVVYHLGMSDEKVTSLPLYELDRIEKIDYLTSLYVKPYQQETQTFSINPLVEIVKTLRSPGGCPWDILQTHRSLRNNLIEETY